MEKLFFVLLLILNSLTVFGAESSQPRHHVSIGTDGLGWSGLSTQLDRNKSKSGIKHQEVTGGNFNLNYNYIFNNRVMLGAELNYEGSKTETQLTSGDKKVTEQDTKSLAFIVGYNFNEDLFNSWWLKLSVGSGYIKTDTKDTTATPEDSESDIDMGFTGLEGGKRFSLDSWGLKNLSYSPSLLIVSASYDEDADDIGLDSSISAQLNIIKFDLLF